MPKFYGAIGYIETVETDPVNHPGVYEEVVTERNYYGDIIRNSRRTEPSSNQLNDDVNISNSFSIVADPYARDHFYAMRYIWWQGAKWKITSVDASNPPRLSLEVGGLYNSRNNNEET